MTEAVEICPYCMGENLFPEWNEKQGYIAKCQHCGKRRSCSVMSASMRNDNPGGKCDWHGADIGTCFRRKQKADAMLGALDRECRDMKELFLSTICDLCHYPHVLHQEALDEQCDKCNVCKNLEMLLRKQRTATASRIMAIVAEEMHPEKKGE